MNKQRLSGALHFITLLLLALLVIGTTASAAIGSQKPTPGPMVAAFSATPVSGDPPLTVVFSDLSTGIPIWWNWTFGDGNTSDTQNTSHTYYSEGQFNVTLKVSDRAGNSTVTRNSYIIVDIPSVSFQSDEGENDQGDDVSFQSDEGESDQGDDASFDLDEGESDQGDDVSFDLDEGESDQGDDASFQSDEGESDQGDDVSFDLDEGESDQGDDASFDLDEGESDQGDDQGLMSPAPAANDTTSAELSTETTVTNAVLREQSRETGEPVTTAPALTVTSVKQVTTATTRLTSSPSIEAPAAATTVINVSRNTVSDIPLLERLKEFIEKLLNLFE